MGLSMVMEDPGGSQNRTEKPIEIDLGAVSEQTGHFCHFLPFSRCVSAIMSLPVITAPRRSFRDGHLGRCSLAFHLPLSRNIRICSICLVDIRGGSNKSKKFKVSAKSVKLSLRTLPVSFHAPGPDSVPKANMFRPHPRGITCQVG